MQTIEIAEEILPVYLAIQKAHGKDYSFAAQITILQKLLRYRGIKKSRASLNRWLRRLEAEKYIRRTSRHIKDKNKGMIFRSTICNIQLKGYHVLRRLGIKVWDEINHSLAKIRSKFPEFGKKRKKAQDSPRRTHKIQPILEALDTALSV